MILRTYASCALLLTGCYLSHELPTDGDAGTACEVPEHDVFHRDDCSFCNAFHFTWLRRCGDRSYVISSSGVRAVFEEGPCGEIELVACALGEDLCVAPDACDGLDVTSFEELLLVRTGRSPRGGELAFEPYEDGGFFEPPSCRDLAGDAPVCE